MENQLFSQFDQLPENLQQEVLDYIEFLIKKYVNSQQTEEETTISASVGCVPRTASGIKKEYHELKTPPQMNDISDSLFAFQIRCTRYLKKAPRHQHAKGLFLGHFCLNQNLLN